nr:hypothetical protein [Clostridia bacterium]
MKKFRLISLILTAVMLIAAAVPVSAAPKVGDPIGDVLYTDIVAYIDGHPIRSYNINWETFIVSEDLYMYGFNVVWYGDTRRVVIYPERTAAPEDYTADYTPGKSGGKNGEVAMPYLYTDVTVWIGSKQIEAYNIGGFMCIMMNDLAAAFAETYTYDDTTRTLKMTSPKFGSTSSDVPVIPDDDDKITEAAVIKAAEQYLNGFIDDFSNFDSVDISELTSLGDIYGDDLISDYMQLLGEICGEISWDVTGAKLTKGGAEVDVKITSRNLEGVISSALTEALAELSFNVKNGETYTDSEVSRLMVEKLFTKIGDDSRPRKNFYVTVYADIDAKGNITFDTENTDELAGALLGGMLNDPLFGGR